jgi:hypothetical protein
MVLVMILGFLIIVASIPVFIIAVPVRVGLSFSKFIADQIYKA